MKGAMTMHGLKVTQRTLDSYAKQLKEVVRSAGNKRPVAVDLFCGCGGFSLGIIQAGFDVLLGLDNDPEALSTYAYNLGADDVRWVGTLPNERWRKKYWNGKDTPTTYGEPCSEFTEESNRAIRAKRDHLEWRRTVKVAMCRDASQVFGWDICEAVGTTEIDLVVGSPPCQSFSKIGKRKVGDPRDHFVFEFARIVREIDPRTFVMENVPDLVKKKLPSGVLIVDVLTSLIHGPLYGLTARDVLT